MFGEKMGEFLDKKPEGLSFFIFEEKNNEEFTP